MKLRFLFFIGLFFVIMSPLEAQSKWQLEKKRKQLRKEIKEAQKLLFKSKQEEETLLSELNDINKLINVRSELIKTIQKEELELSYEIEKNQKEIDRLKKSLNTLKKEYAQMIVQSYKTKTKQSRLMFLLSSENFSQAYKRLQYLKQVSSYRKLQGEEIKHTQVELTALNDSLTLHQDEKVLLIALHNKEQDSIKKEKNSQERLVQKVKQKEQKYTAQIKAKQREEARIDRQIQNLIKAAIAKSNAKGNTKSSGFSMSPEEKLVASNFVANKGKLPWPVERYVVVRRYGKQKHPTMPGITINSNGIRLATEANAKARSVFKGKVLAIQLQPGRKKMVYIQHGNYISVYKNLKSVLVKSGQAIKTKQQIGTIHTDAVTGKTILEFALFKNTSIQNPENWISQGGSIVASAGK
ncbi:MAG: peptidoglycan DD-metalloendopeptidase family protein [Flavobacteriaceae bacterium]|nr:peptidoglycan DD-metalloendopeptidase family protein [Flavobacteriaceae bacterium]